MSTLGAVLLLVAAGTVLGITRVLLARRTAARVDRTEIRNLSRTNTLIGLLCIVIAVDDLVVVHEAPGFGIHENVAIAVYVATGLALAFIATPVLRRERLLLPFAAALGLLAASVAGDLLEFLVRDGDPMILAVAGHGEDIVKLLGFVAMAFLCERLAARLHGRVVQADNHGTP